jgi:hypothetical protein
MIKKEKKSVANKINLYIQNNKEFFNIKNNILVNYTNETLI